MKKNVTSGLAVLLSSLIFAVVPFVGAWGQNTLEISNNTTLAGLNGYNLVQFTGGGFVLTLNGETGGALDATLRNKNGTDGVYYPSDVVKLSSPNGATWTIRNGNSREWTGTIMIDALNTLSVVNDSAGSKEYSLGLWSTATNGTEPLYATANINGKGTLSVSRDLNVGAIVTTEATATNPAEIRVAAGNTLSVYNGFVNTNSTFNGSQAGRINKTGDGDLTVYTKYNGLGVSVGDLNLLGGKFTLRPTTSTFFKQNDIIDYRYNPLMDGAGGVSFNSITMAQNTTLDIMTAGKVYLAGMNVNGGIVNIYVQETQSNGNGNGNGNSAFSNTQFFVSQGDASFTNTTFVIDNQTMGSVIPSGDLVLVTAQDSSNLFIDDKTVIKSNILGKGYTANIQEYSGYADLVAVEYLRYLNDPVSLLPLKSANAKNAANYIDNAVHSNKYGSLYRPIDLLQRIQDANPELLDGALKQTTGEIYSSAVNFGFLSNYIMLQQLSQQLRSVPLVAYNEGTAPATAAAGQYSAGGAGGYTTGGMYSAPYGPGYAPAYQAAPNYQGGSQGATVPIYQGQPAYQQGTNYQLAPPVTKLNSVFEQSLLRGQSTANYGDPGTLIYSAWATALGGTGVNTAHHDAAGYDTERYGGMVGIDLFGCSDCRSGIFYGYQQNKMKQTVANYGSLKSDESTLGLYHHWGDEFVYNIITLRGGYDTFNFNRTINMEIPGSVNPEDSLYDALSSKPKGYRGSLSYERGANFQLGSAIILSPYVGADYTYFHRDSFTESSSPPLGGISSGLALSGKATGYHSLHSVVGATAALRMYPGSMEIALLARGNWTHEFLDDIYGKQSMSFVGMAPGAGNFNVVGNSLGRDWGLFGLGAEFAPIPNLLLFANWDWLKNEYTSEHLGSAGLSIRW